MKRLAIVLVLTIASPGFAVQMVRVEAALLSPDLRIIKQEWYQTPPPSPSACFHHNASGDSVVESLERYGTLCSDTRKLQAYSQGTCPRETSEEQEGESASRASEYTYKVRVYNSGDKTIKAIVWDYIFLDPRTNNELSRHIFHSESQLTSRKTRTLIATSVNPPTRVITVGMLLNNNAGNYGERVEIERVEYADGSVWDSALDNVSRLPE